MRTVAKDVMDFLEWKGYIEVDRSSTQSMQNTLRSVQRYLAKKGYKCGKKKGGVTYHLKAKRDAYVHCMIKAKCSKALKDCAYG